MLGSRLIPALFWTVILFHPDKNIQATLVKIKVKIVGIFLVKIMPISLSEHSSRSDGVKVDIRIPVQFFCYAVIMSMVE